MQIIFNRHKDRILTDTIAQGRSVPGSNDSNRSLHRAPELDFHHQTEFNVILRTYL